MSDEYPLTTEQVRDSVIDAGPWTMNNNAAVIAFDRWLAAHDATVRAEQREADARIAETHAVDLTSRVVYRNPQFDVIAARIRASSLVGETGADTETVKLDPLPYVNPQIAPGSIVPIEWRYSYPIRFEYGVSRYDPRPEYSQNPADYGITPEPSTETEL